METGNDGIACYRDMETDMTEGELEKIVPLFRDELYARGGSQVVLPDDRHIAWALRKAYDAAYPSLSACTILTVECQPRYWEDTSVNGIEDKDGSLIPFREGDAWKPRIDLETGKIIGWPEGMTASIHYKVCDEGMYWLGTRDNPKVFQYGSPDDWSYVPDDFLCHGDTGYGDYIILNVDGTGQIQQYERPVADNKEWVRYAQ